MNKSEVALVVASLKPFGQYVGDDMQVTVETWAASFDNDMPVDFAVNYVTRWYSQPDAQRILPGHINSAWKDHKRRGHRPAILARDTDRMPMPEWFKAAMIDAFGSTQLGRAPKRGVDVQRIFDDALAIAEEGKWRPFAS